VKRHWQVELAQAKRRVKVLEYLLARSMRIKPVIGGGVSVIGKVRWILENYWLQTLEEIAARLKPCGIGKESVAYALYDLSRNAEAQKLKKAGEFPKWQAIR
jgi:hypothetical protein